MANPEIVLVEIGNVDASTVVVTFSEGVISPTYSQGVIIKVNGAEVEFTAARQADHKVVYYVLTSPAIEGDVVTFEYMTEPAGQTGVFDNNFAWTSIDWRGK